jgi:hypothetical protein
LEGLEDELWGEVIDGEGFLSGGEAVFDVDLGAGAVEEFGEEIYEGVVGFGIDGWCCDSDAEVVAEFALDGVLGGAGLDADGEEDVVGFGGEPWGHGSRGVDVGDGIWEMGDGRWDMGDIGLRCFGDESF